MTAENSFDIIFFDIQIEGMGDIEAEGLWHSVIY